MNRMMTVFRQIWATPDLRQKILYTLGLLLIFRVAAHITVPGANMQQVKFIMENSGQTGALSVFSLLTGGAMERFSIVLMGLTPYINASIIMQLMAVVMPSIENLKKEGEAGQKKINQYTRLLTVPLAFLQSYGMMFLVNSFSPVPIIDVTDPMVIVPAMLIVTAGSVFLMWLGELITERGIGNGISLIIFAGIVATVPTQIGGALQATTPAVFAGLTIGLILLTVFIVYVSEAERRVPIIYANKKSGLQQKSFLPMKINMAGMIPIIFAVSLLSMPSIAGQFMVGSSNEMIANLGTWFQQYVNPASPSVWYNIVYAVLIYAFTFFYVQLVYEPAKVADNIQKRGGFIPGYRPGSETVNLLGGISERLTFWGALFLAFVAVAPLPFERMMSGGTGAVTLFISGAGLIIVVSVVLDLIRRINARLVMQDYDKI